MRKKAPSKAELRKQWCYDADAPRCSGCIHYAPPTRGVSPMCKLGDFTTAPMAICDKWQNKKGETVE